MSMEPERPELLGGEAGGLAGDAALPPDPQRRRAVGIDIGGTKIATGVVTADGYIVERALVPTPMDDEPATVLAMLGAIEELRARHPGVEAIGVGAAGLVEWPSGRVRWAPHNAYRELSLRRLLYEATGLPTVVDNDANAAAWAEARFGAGVGSDHMVLLTVGTGIGGGLVLGGQVYRGSSGFGVEVGHMIVDPDGPACPCGQRGCWERFASGSGLGRLAREAVGGGRADRVLALAGGDPEAVRGEHVTRAVAEGDAQAVEVLGRFAWWVALGLANLANIFDPEAFVLGGGLVRAGEALLAPTASALRDLLPPQRPEVRILPATLGERAGAVGAACLAATRR